MIDTIFNIILELLCERNSSIDSMPGIPDWPNKRSRRSKDVEEARPFISISAIPRLDIVPKMKPVKNSQNGLPAYSTRTVVTTDPRKSDHISSFSCCPAIRILNCMLTYIQHSHIMNHKCFSQKGSQNGTSRLQKGKYQGEYSLIAGRSSQTEPRIRI